jgi:transposase
MGAVQEVRAAPYFSPRYENYAILSPMSKGKSDKITYKPYGQGQAYLIPPSVDELIPADHLVRLVSGVIDEMGIERVLRKHQTGGGASRYHPEMMTKLFVYGYMTKVCSSRMLAKAARENAMFMRLSGGQKPDFRTLNDFRGKMLKEAMEEIFVTAVKMLKAKGRIKLENYFIDGTKIESAAGRYTFVWKKAVETNDKKLDGNCGRTYGWRKTFGKTRTGSTEKRIWKNLAGRTDSPAAT